MKHIEITGLQDMDEKECNTIRKVAEKYYERVQRKFSRLTTIVMHIKSHKKKKVRKKYTVLIKAIAPKKFVSIQSVDWDAKNAIRKGFRAVCNRIQSRTKIFKKVHIGTTI